MQKYEILLVDDDVFIQDSIGGALEKEGYSVTIAGNGKAAIEKVEKQRFDLVLTDLVMPPIDGLGVLEKVKAVSPDTMVILLTGFGDLKSAIKAIQLGAEDYLLKPIDVEEIFFRVASCLEKLELKIKERRYREALEKAKGELEGRVEKRTAELAESNAKLKKEVEERKKVEAALKESELKYRGIFENIADVYYRADLEGRVLLASPSAVETLGYESLDEIVGKNIAKDFYSDPQARENFLNQILKNGKAKFHSVLKCKDGKSIIAETNSRLVYDANGEVVGLEGIFRDITDRVDAEKRLKQSEERFRMLVETMHEGLVVQDETGRITYGNRAFFEMLGRPEAKLVGRPLADFFERKDKNLYKKQMLTLGEEVKSIEMTWVDQNGKKISTRVSPVPLYEGGGRLKGTFAVVTDITDLKETENTLRKREAQLKTKRDNLEEVNAALKVLLQKREEDKIELEDNVMSSVAKLIKPYFEKIKKTDLNEQQRAFLSIMESNFNEITSPFARKMSMKYLNLTTAELQIANMIKQGHITKKIAKLRRISPRTVDTHRKNIRRKLGLENKKANLRSHLLSLG